ncbi:MarR family winged helix-turn-helix transcriptional regulator [Roseibium litorale]|nr:MarR family winged helix-turn-helix transcriptional regulator [Roseibium litorale]
MREEENDGGPGETRHAALSLERLAVQLLQYRPREARTNDLSTQQIIIMAAIADRPGCGVNALSAQTGMFQSTISRSLSGLLKKGLVRREKSPKDTRAVELFLSDEGQRIISSTRQEWRDRVSAMLAEMVPSDRASLLTGLDLLVRAIPRLSD